MRFARWSFALAAVYGLVATLGLYRTPLSAATLWLYGFAGAAAATQLLYVAIAVDPRRLRPAILIGVASKLSFAVPVLMLHARGATTNALFAAALVDLALAALFAWHWWRLGRGGLR